MLSSVEFICRFLVAILFDIQKRLFAFQLLDFFYVLLHHGEDPVVAVGINKQAVLRLLYSWDFKLIGNLGLEEIKELESQLLFFFDLLL